jgi:hypothetical protein
MGHRPRSRGGTAASVRRTDSTRPPTTCSPSFGRPGTMAAEAGGIGCPPAQRHCPRCSPSRSPATRCSAPTGPSPIEVSGEMRRTQADFHQLVGEASSGDLHRRCEASGPAGRVVGGSTSWPLDYSAGPQPRDGPRRTCLSVSVPRPRSGRSVRGVVRRGHGGRGDRGGQDPAAVSVGELLRRTLRVDSADRGHRPDADLRRATPAQCARPVCGALQPEAAASIGGATSAAPGCDCP